jgi:LmbE family N-acetylglucosaminyl deacetylase
MNSIARILLAAGALVLASVLLVPALSGSAGAAEPPSCTGRTMLFVAHEDDDLLFIGPRLQSELNSGRCIRTVFLTAGDDGKPQSYWGTREEGVEAAYSQMAGVADAWTPSTVTANGHTLLLKTLTGDPRISVVFMRLPDGGFPAGTGTPAYGNQSLMKLWNGGNPCSGCAEESTITAVDNSNTFTYASLIGTLTDLMGSYGPRQIYTQNFEEVFFNGDHPDHISTARFTKAAAAVYAGAHRLTGYVGYNTESRPANVSGEALTRKSEAFYAYGAHDTGACDSAATCVGEYEIWLAREYVAGRMTTGVVANAAFGQEVTAGAEVTLNGSGSSDQSGAPLTYEWTQVGGPSVTLVNPTTAKPTFTMVSHPTLLTFELTVSDGTTTSSPDYVQVRVPSADPAPVAIAGPTQTVGTHETVHLDGSASWDPNSLPLEYEWEEVSGPPVTLTGPETAAPTFVAPLGPAEVTLALVVSNGTQTSAPSTVTVEVLGFPPTFTNATAATFTAGTFGSFTFTTEGSPAADLFLDGELPPGIAFVDNGDGTATLSGTAPKSVAAAGTGRAYPVDLEAINEYGEETQGFTLTVAVPSDPPPTPEPPVPTPEPEKQPTPTPTPTPTSTGSAPAFISPNVAYAYVGRPLAASIEASGTPAPNLTLVGGAPAGLTFQASGPGSARLSGKPREAKSYSLDLTADSSAGKADQQLRLVVDPLPKLSRATVGLQVGRRSKRAVTVKGSGIIAVSCQGPLPPGVRVGTIGARRIVLAGAPTAGSAGSYEVRLKVVGRAGTVTRRLTVKVSS